MNGSLAAKGAIIVVMALGSVVMWLVNPVAWIWGVSQLADSTQVTMTQIVVLMVGIPGTMVVLGQALGRLNRLYGRVSGQQPSVRIAAPWHRSMRDSRDAGAPRTILDVVMVASVAVAIALMGVWFAFFAHGGGLPN